MELVKFAVTVNTGFSIAPREFEFYIILLDVSPQLQCCGSSSTIQILESKIENGVGKKARKIFRGIFYRLQNPQLPTPTSLSCDYSLFIQYTDIVCMYVSQQCIVQPFHIQCRRFIIEVRFTHLLLRTCMTQSPCFPKPLPVLATDTRCCLLNVDKCRGFIDIYRTVVLRQLSLSTRFLCMNSFSN